MGSRLSRRQFLAGTGMAGAAVLAGGSRVFAAKQGITAATVIQNGRVYTGTGGSLQQALAIGADGTILDVGTNSALKRWIGSGTRTIDAGGGTVMAGIHDGHVHPLYAGIMSLSPSLYNAELPLADLQGYLQSYLDASAGQEPDVWLEVYDWNPVAAPNDAMPAHKEQLDALNTHRPIALHGSDGHNAWTNSRGLAVAGVTRDTPTPDGGTIVKDANGEPTGVFKDTAVSLIFDKIPPASEAVQLRAMADALAIMAANGITSFMDASVPAEWMDAYAALAGMGAIRQRVQPALRIPDELHGDPSGALAWAEDIKNLYDGIPGVRLGTVKTFMDGVMEYPAQTAALLEPYLDYNGNPTDNYGNLYVDGPTYGGLAKAFDAAGWQMHAHAIGDAAVRAALDGYEMAYHANGRRDNRHAIAHLQLVHPDDYGRFAKLKVIPDMQLQWAIRDVWTLDALEPFIGEERHKRLYPAKSMADKGARLAGGSDWPVDPLIPFNQIETAVDRIGYYGSVYGDGLPLNADQGITLDQSLVMHTKTSAYQLHQEKLTGTLEVGKQADLLIADRDISAVPISEVYMTQVAMTMVGGAPTFDATSSAGAAIVRKAEKIKAAQNHAGLRKNSHAFMSGRHAGCPCNTKK